MEHASFVVGSYVVTFLGIALYVRYVLRSGHRLSSQIPDEDKPWT